MCSEKQRGEPVWGLGLIEEDSADEEGDGGCSAGAEEENRVVSNGSLPGARGEGGEL